MQINIICPFYRQYLLPTLIKYLEPMHIQWHPVCDPIDIQAFSDNTKQWIHPVLCKPFRAGEMCYRKINDWIDLNLDTINNDDYYGFMGDDDMYEPGFFDIVRQQTAKILMYSCYRGDAKTNNPPPAENHPAHPLIINGLDDVHVGKIGLGMYILKGSILRQMKFNITHKWGDGAFAQDLKAKWPNYIKFLTDLFVFGNYFEPGRFNTSEKFLKSSWRLPKYE
jgi:hypothetical protein